MPLRNFHICKHNFFCLIGKHNMKQNLKAEKSIVVNAPAETVWKALTDPHLIRQYLFGTETITDWKVGSQIRWQGEWQGKKYEDKGKIIAADAGRLLEYTYWSSMQGKEDKPENYAHVSFELFGENGRTKVKLVQDGNDTEESKRHAEQNWTKVLEGLKKVAEEDQ
jgi:uncharacterized protein YndB with AHSA1/START domain